MKTITIKDVYLREAVFTKEQLEQALEEFNKPEFDYPICCKSKIEGDDTVVLFSTESEGINLTRPNGYTEYYIQPHTDSTIWEQIPYDKEKVLYHKQLIYCWQNDDTHTVSLRFYDAINRCAFSLDAKLAGKDFQNYSTTMPEHMKEFKEL
jgi:hypothetical protein